ncbi:uncharacterized protein LOC107024836 [Solanum pennellii]|uniref:Uncharacterized protein LOC107024836 n=1 Tax=Solanum pennellii TaxID=28526 RepID=A0ABM1H726_SOLPN|nr:uncharacterized protein LOC107024836 [Solanum pennellii]
MVCNKVFSELLTKYGVKQHKIATPYHPQTNGQVEKSNREINAIFAKIINANMTDLARKLDDTLWACHLLVEHDHRALWALKKLNLNWSETTNFRLDQINEMDEFRLRAY